MCAKPDVMDYELGSENRQGELALSRTAPPRFRWLEYGCRALEMTDLIRRALGPDVS
jgi:hypothetical protein